MMHGTKYLMVAVILLGSAVAGAQGSAESVSGLPLAPGMKRTGDPVQSYKFCGKSASRVLYLASGFADMAHESAWYTHAVPGAVAFTADTGVKTFITRDGTAAVELADAFILYMRFTPGLSAAEMKILGAAPAATSCTAD